MKAKLGLPGTKLPIRLDDSVSFFVKHMPEIWLGDGIGDFSFISHNGSS